MVVGEDSADSVVCVDVLSLCLWVESEGRAPGRNAGSESCGCFVGPRPITSLGSTTVTRDC